MIKDSKYIQDNNVNKEYYKQIYDDNVVEVIVIKDFKLRNIEIKRYLPSFIP
jgi:hypothetical protein